LEGSGGRFRAQAAIPKELTMRANATQWRLTTLLLAGALCAMPALAEKPDHAGGPKQGKHADKAERKADKREEKAERKADKREEKAERKADKQQAKARDDRAEQRAGVVDQRGRPGRQEPRQGAYFDDRHREAVRTYYVRNDGGRACPPGLAKKNNGCMPPGQAKKWQVGQRLPTGVTYTSVPRPILVQLPPQPQGYRYVRVSTDILLIAITTQLVVDAILLQ
jgi:Ni/Co efflux regulator RcnB